MTGNIPIKKSFALTVRITDDGMDELAKCSWELGQQLAEVAREHRKRMIDSLRFPYHVIREEPSFLNDFDHWWEWKLSQLEHRNKKDNAMQVLMDRTMQRLKRQMLEQCLYG